MIFHQMCSNKRIRLILASFSTISSSLTQKSLHLLIMYTDKLITSRKYFRMAAKSGFPFYGPPCMNNTVPPRQNESTDIFGKSDLFLNLGDILQNNTELKKLTFVVVLGQNSWYCRYRTNCTINNSWYCRYGTNYTMDNSWYCRYGTNYTMNNTAPPRQTSFLAKVIFF